MNRLVLVLCAGVGVAGCGAPDVPATTTADGRLHAILEADDQRATPEAAAAAIVLRDALADLDTEVRAAAVRALGRLETPERVGLIAGIARGDRDPSVRVAAAHALAQSVQRGDGGLVLAPLADLLTSDPDNVVRGAAATGIGRARYGNPEHLRRAEQALRDTQPLDDPDVAAGVARGLAALRRNHRGHEFDPDTAALLEGLAMPDASSAAPDEFVRVAAAQALAASGTYAATLAGALGDASAEVRRVAVQALAVGGNISPEQLDAAMRDPVGRVRYAVVQAAARERDLANDDAAQRCDLLAAAMEDSWAAIRLAAIGGSWNCPAAMPALTDLSATVTDDHNWHERAQALVALARADGVDIRAQIERAAADDTWQVRMYAARASGEVADIAQLRRLADDAHPNVREAALRGLQAHLGHAADDVYAAALAATDYQLVLTAAGALRGADGNYLEAVFAALERITAERRETSRDPRAALLDTALDNGSARDLARVEPYLRDFDPAIAARAAEIMAEWGRTNALADPQPLPRQPFPTLARLRDLDDTRIVLHMAGGDRIALRMSPFAAPTNVARFARQAADGYFDGLTLHRVVFNFVLQGGSPGANEYVGSADFARDEITARAHRRGTVGISTRGRDTADGQIFINLVDNLRLDFDYTIIGEVVAGLEALDRVLEGAIIEHVTLESDPDAG